LPSATDQTFNNRSAPGATPRFALPVSAMVPTFDLGSPVMGKEQTCLDKPGTPVCWWIHCRNKTEVARRLALQLARVWTAPGGAPLPAAAEWSGPTVSSTALVVDSDTHRPHAVVSFAHAGGLALRGAQRCFHCCDQAATPPVGQVGHGEYLFEVANRKGVWMPAAGGSVDPVSGTIKVFPNTTVTCKSAESCWLAAVRYAVLDVPQCALYNAADLPASQFELPVPWALSSLRLALRPPSVPPPANN
jgi:hypothetical protein